MQIQRLSPRFLSITALIATAAGQSTSFTFDGAQAEGRMGSAVLTGLDLDLDGYDDFVLGEPVPYAGIGRVTAYSGRDHAELWSLVDSVANSQFGAALGSPGDLDLDGRPDVLIAAPDPTAGGQVFAVSGLDGSSIHVLTSTEGTRYGIGLSTLGDVDEDGTADFIVGDPGAAIDANGNWEFRGAVYAYSGRTAELMWKAWGYEFFAQYGQAVCGGVDLDGDGVLEVLIGTPDKPPVQQGFVELRDAATGAAISWTYSNNPYSRFGSSICALGDVTGDGLQDVAVGAPSTPDDSTPTEAVHLLSGHSLELVRTLWGPHGSRFGTSVADAGDYDGDGLSDVLVGAPNGLPMVSTAGRATIVSSASLDALHTFLGSASGSRFGTAVGVGDCNGDGELDVLVGAPQAAPNGPNSGAARLFLMADAAGTPDCFGDGSGAACPCGASGVGERAGCPNSTGAAGKLSATGAARIGADTVRLVASGLPNSPCLFFQGSVLLDDGAGAPFADGLRCAGGAVTRLAVRTSSGGNVEFPSAGDPTLSATGSAQVGDALHYQLWYRDAASFCTSATSNLTNSYSIHWQP